MPRTTGAHRRLFTGTDTLGAVPVDYRFHHARNGNRRLVVVLANFDAPEDYGWSNGVLDNLRANILWIRDRFDGHNSYYLCKGMDFAIEESVAAVIHRFLDALALTPADCTLLGSSKGATAALYYTLAHGFGNAVAVAPQFAIGSYVRDVHPEVARFMTRQDERDGDVAALDALLPDLVRRGSNRSAGVYLLSSVADPQYRTQVEPYLTLFGGYENVNVVLTDSPFVTRHTQVAGRNVPVIMGLVNCLIDGITPRLGFARNGYEDPQADRTAVEDLLAATSTSPDSWVPTPVISAPLTDQHLPAGAVRFAGTARAASKVQLWEDGHYLGTADVADDGRWAWTGQKAWSRGRHLVKVFAVNGDGVESERALTAFSVRARGD
ncbi:hypothetical protein [Streptomyces sp. CB03234]|uniref:hypothetical protein n=1 Tax=Streptomyces sp. (strain CB03234) TaxID=1703937 RepID=UPI00093B08A0|nr:hypothetical protein [Streptomyces sp. CB03234]